ncbi:MAG: SOS response regulatory protein OraA/RecX [Gammaproteobacteria bacterium]|jgi:SOS response regulatory protein OraA/RecX
MLLQRHLLRHLYIDTFNQNNLQSNKRFSESLNRGRLNKGIGESRVCNELQKYQISAVIVASAMRELSIDEFELAIKVF